MIKLTVSHFVLPVLFSTNIGLDKTNKSGTAANVCVCIAQQVGMTVQAFGFHITVEQ